MTDNNSHEHRHRWSSPRICDTSSTSDDSNTTRASGRTNSPSGDISDSSQSDLTHLANDSRGLSTPSTSRTWSESESSYSSADTLNFSFTAGASPSWSTTTSATTPSLLPSPSSLADEANESFEGEDGIHLASLALMTTSSTAAYAKGYNDHQSFHGSSTPPSGQGASSRNKTAADVNTSSSSVHDASRRVTPPEIVQHKHRHEVLQHRPVGRSAPCSYGHMRSISDVGPEFKKAGSGVFLVSPSSSSSSCSLAKVSGLSCNTMDQQQENQQRSSERAELEQELRRAEEESEKIALTVIRRLDEEQKAYDSSRRSSSTSNANNLVHQSTRSLTNPPATNTHITSSSIPSLVPANALGDLSRLAARVSTAVTLQHQQEKEQTLPPPLVTTLSLPLPTSSLLNLTPTGQSPPSTALPSDDSTTRQSFLWPRSSGEI